MTIGFYCYAAGAVANALLAGLLTATGRGHERSNWLIVASASMAAWAAAMAVQEAYGLLSAPMVWTLEALHIYIWLVFFSKLLHQGKHPKAARSPDRIRHGIAVVTMLQIVYIWVSPMLGGGYADSLHPSYPLIGHIGQVVIGLVLVEQYYRNARLDQRWRIKFLCFAIGTLFVYDFYLYTDALWFERIRGDLWVARGAVVALLPPLIAISATRNPDWSVDIFVSRQAVFHSVTFLGSGSYLLLMATASYYLKLYGGEWGTVVQVVFMVSAVLVLLLVLFSGQIRAHIRVFLNKNFFNYVYDYRQEWLRLIGTLSDRDSGLLLEERVILALGQVVESPSGVLWTRESNGQFVFRASYGDPDIRLQTISANDAIVTGPLAQGWVVNIQEMIARPELYGDMPPPYWITIFENAWLLVPLTGKEAVSSIVLLTKPRTPIVWNWEVIDMLKITSRLCASYLALEDAAKALAEARQFEGFNRLSAFVIHDLKNLIAQLSLVVRNADKHLDNPEFMRDAITTVDHAVGKMNTLMSQLRNASPAAATAPVVLNDLVQEVVGLRKKQAPPPLYEPYTQPLTIIANRDRLASALEHIIHNAQDAATKGGRVVVRVKPGDGNSAWIDVEDNGHGMDAEFIRTRLFKPFETTKGLTGMGIGAYESREYVRAIKGELTVQSEPGKGSLFRFKIPLAEPGDLSTAKE